VAAQSKPRPLPTPSTTAGGRVKEHLGPYTVLRSAIFAHPTVAEGLTFLLAGPPTS
jgi:hypothetical protein